MMRTVGMIWMAMLFAMGVQAQVQTETQARTETQADRIDFSRLFIGVFGGPNISNYAIQAGALDAGNRFGYQVGGFLRYGERVYLQSGLTYYNMNSRLRQTHTTGNMQFSDRVNTSYLQLPLLAGVRIYQQRRRDLRLRVQAGPSVSVLMRVNENELQLSSNDYRNLWFGAQGGLGLDVWFFSLDLGYQMGLSDTFSGTNYDGRFRMATLSLGVTF